MLVNRPSAFIFQHIVLPHLASTRTYTHTTQRYFSSTYPVNRPLTEPASTSRETNWPPYATPGSGSARRRTKEYLEYEGDGQPQAIAEEGEGELYKRTMTMALERIISIHQPGEGSRAGLKGKGKERDMLGQKRTDLEDRRANHGLKGKGKERDGLDRTSTAVEHRRDNHGLKGEGKERDVLDQKRTDLEDRRDDLGIDPESSSSDLSTSTNERRITSTTNTTTKTSTSPSPSPQIKREQPFPPLIHQLLQARQYRLATLHILNVPLYALDTELTKRVADFVDRKGAGRAARRLRRGLSPSPEEKDLMEGEGKDKLPDNYWSLISSRSRPPPKTLDDLKRYMPGIELNHQQKFTIFCNIQLAHFLSSSPGSGVIPPKPFPRPNPSLHQLRSLIAKINKLEQHRGFIPDRVTANLILKCWLRCSLSPELEGSRVVKSRQGWKIAPRHTSLAQGVFGQEELRGLFGTVSRLIDRSMEGGMDDGLSYTRHVGPFANTLTRAFRELDDVKGLEMVRKWAKGVRRVFDERRQIAEQGEADGPSTKSTSRKASSAGD